MLVNASVYCSNATCGKTLLQWTILTSNDKKASVVDFYNSVCAKILLNS